MQHDHLLSIHLQSASFAISLICYQPHLLSPHLLSIHMLSINLLSIPLLSIHLLSIHLLSIHLLSIHLLSVSLPLATLAMQPQLLSSQFAIRPHLLSKRLFFSLNCYQCLTAIQNQLLLKYVAIKISCFLNKLQSNQFLVAIKNLLLSR